MPLHPSFAEFCAAQGYPLDDRAVGDFEAFEEDLYRLNEVANLTRVPRAECSIRHFLDSVLLIGHIPRDAAVLDLGCGPGFPAWPLARVRPDLKVTALDSSGKALGFLRRHPLPNLDIVEARAEEWPVREKFDWVTGRALAPLPLQLELSAPPCRIGGAVVPFRTPRELDAVRSFPAGRLGLVLESLIEAPLPSTDVVRLFPVFRKERATDPRFPRTWTRMRRAPLGGR